MLPGILGSGGRGARRYRARRLMCIRCGRAAGVRWRSRASNDRTVLTQISVLFWMITEGRSNACSILDDFVLLHPDIELLDFGNPKILQMFRRLFES
jgi:hypothetical protein